MATEKQYQFFQSLYEEELKRENQLRDHAKNYLSLATFYSAFIIFVVEKLKPNSALSMGLFVATVVSMLGAFFLSLWAMKISAFEAVNDPRDVINQFGDSPMSDSDFFDNRIADYTVAYERNSVINDSKALKLELAGYTVLVGMALHACYFVVRSHS